MHIPKPIPLSLKVSLNILIFQELNKNQSFLDASLAVIFKYYYLLWALQIQLNVKNRWYMILLKVFLFFQQPKRSVVNQNQSCSDLLPLKKYLFFWSQMKEKSQLQCTKSRLFTFHLLGQFQASLFPIFPFQICLMP